MTGRVLNNKFRIIDAIGSGGMSIVYKAERIKDKRIFAIKVLKNEYINDPEHIALFKREAEIAISLNHVNIRRVFALCRDKDVMYMVMEYVDGDTIKDIIRKYGRLNYEYALEIAIQISRALRCAHQKGLIHRDIKPHNILITPNGMVKVTDFGIAYKNDSDTIVVNNSVLGSVYYIAPEQASGNVTDSKTDIYSLGIVLYEMVTGQLPFEGETSVSIAIKQMHEQILRPSEIVPDIPRSVDEIVLKATEKEPELRYASAVDMQADMMRAIEDPHGEFVAGDLGKPGYDDEKPKKGILKRMIPAAIILVLLLAAVILTWILVSGGQDSYNQDDMVSIPDVLGMQEQRAVNELRLAGLNAEVSYEPSLDNMAGKVIHQEPAALMLIGKGERVNITVASPDENQFLPDFTGMDLDTAVDKIASLGLQEPAISFEDSEENENMVVGQLPKAGSEMAQDIEITLIVSRKTDSMAVVPDVTGLNLYKADSIIREMRFETGIIFKEDNPENKNTVLKQSPGADMNETEKTKVDLWIGYDPNEEIPFECPFQLEVSEDICKVMITLVDSDGLEYFVMESQYEKGTHTIEPVLFSSQIAEKELVIYVDGEEYRRYPIAAADTEAAR